MPPMSQMSQMSPGGDRERQAAAANAARSGRRQSRGSRRQATIARSGNAPTIIIIALIPITSPMPPSGTIARPAKPHEKPMIREDAIAGESPECRWAGRMKAPYSRMANN